MDESTTPPLWIVQKYGGTSLGKFLDAITGSIVPTYRSTHKVAVVCSARSSTNKSKGTTSLLLDAINCATSSETSTTGLNAVIDTLKADHLEAARYAVGNDIECFKQLCTDIDDDCEKLRKFLNAAWTVGEISDRTQDRALSTGENLSCRIVAASLSSKVSFFRPSYSPLPISNRVFLRRLYFSTILCKKVIIRASAIKGSILNTTLFNFYVDCSKQLKPEFFNVEIVSPSSRVS